MHRSERSTYTPIDFLEWRETGNLVISPKFQRRGVWNREQRSYLVDTLLLGLPVPPIYVRVVQSTDSRSVIREIIDGQQRLSAVLDYIEDKYTLGNKVESDCAGRHFSELLPEQQNAIARYPFICEVFYGVADEEVLRIFARLNTHSVKLNDQELRNGEFFGAFKQTCYGLALEHLEFWRENRVFTEQRIARMLEVELTSELIIAGLSGLQDKKKSINSFYERYDEEFKLRKRVEERFRSTIDVINNASTVGLSSTEFRRVPIFYSLFTAVQHRLYGIPNCDLPTAAKSRVTKDEIEGIENAISKLSQIVQNAKDGLRVPEARAEFVTACLRQTDNIRPRQIRMETIYQASFL
jgi:hypothetical protein